MIYASYDHNMPTFEVFLSFFFLFHFFMFAKTIHPLLSMRKAFLCTPTFLYMNFFFVYTRIKTLSLYINTVYIQTLFLFKDFFFNIHSWFIQKFLCIHSLLTHKNFFSHLIYKHTKSFRTFFLLHMKNSFLFFIYIDTTFVHNASFFFLFLSISWFLFILFLGRRS